ncbi:Na+-dependent transporter [Aliirhizobium smilacinae]|uniref:Na+-dependent transporter n=1 Tax=Aliirhizobium smilacinae TaxID=1395944 RepID=A0A5C4XC03_9HYPH|nr:Na+-dependent transporter [Rhizobium smilacinae]TNM60995.1 Na+-dependent transporter [Rhizobium smilacinae]
MTFAQIIPLVLTASIFLNVLALGLAAGLEDAAYLFRKPFLLLRAVLSMNVLMVLIVVVAASFFQLTFPVKVALLALAVSPMPPLLPTKEHKHGATRSYAVGLLVAAVLLSLVFIPWSIEWIGRYFGTDARVGASNIVSIVLITAIVPLAVGMMANWLLPNLAARVRRSVSILSMILLVIGVVPILFTMWGTIWATIVNGSLIALACFTILGLGVGHVLGGPEPGNRTALALATSTRHPGMALMIAATNFPDQKAAFMAVIILHLTVGALVSIPYLRWRKGRDREALSPR